MSLRRELQDARDRVMGAIHDLQRETEMVFASLFEEIEETEGREGEPGE